MTLRPLCGMAVAVAMLTAPQMTGTTPLLVWNASPSVPRGLYAVERTPPKVGDLVLIRLPARLAAFAARRGYLPRGVVLIKPVVALTGDTVCRRGVRISVRGKLAAKAHSADAAGRPLPSWHGCRTLQLGELFLLSDHADGFDSRYFGVLSVRSVVGHAIYHLALRRTQVRWSLAL